MNELLKFQNIFNKAPVSLWEENCLETKKMMDSLAAQIGIENIPTYLNNNQDFVRKAEKSVIIQNVNANTLQLYEADNKEQMIKSIEATNSEITNETFKKILYSMAQNKNFFMGETIAKTCKNKIINILIHVSFPDAAEDYEHIIVSIIDITKFKSLEQEIEEMYKFVCKSPVVLFKWNNENGWPVKFVTRNVYQLTGYLPDEFTNKNVFRNSIIHPEDVATVENLTNAYIEIGGGEYRQEYRIITKNKEIKWVRENGFSFAKSENNCEVKYFTTMMFDITEEKRLKDKSSDNLKKFKNLLETTKTAFVILNGYNEIVEANDVFFDLVKCEDHKLILGKKLFDLSIPEDNSKMKRAFERLEGGTAIEDLEVCFRIDNQKESIWVRINANIMENGDRKTFCLVRDITSKKIEEFKKYIENQKQKDKLKQNINKIREKIQDIINLKPNDKKEGK